MPETQNSTYNGNILLHVGYPKAGSSTFQDVLRNIETIHCVARRTTDGSDEELNDALRELITKDSIDYDEDALTPVVDRFRVAESEGRTNVLSEEIATAASRAYVDRDVMARRLKSHFPNSNVLIILRNQFEIIRSRYQHCPYDILCHNKHRMPQLTFREWIDDNVKKLSGSYFTTYQYDKLVATYQKYFGADKVHVVLFEEMVNNPGGFWTRIEGILDKDIGVEAHVDRFAKVHANKAKDIGGRRKMVRRFLRKLPAGTAAAAFVQRCAPTIRSKSRHRLVIPDEYIPFLHGLYCSGNRWMEERFDMDLEQWGYPTPDDRWI